MKKLICKFLTLFLTCTCLHAQEQVRQWQFVRVIDGDTIVFLAPEFPRPLQQISVRLKGIDTPESTWRADCPQEENLGLEAKAFVTDWFNNYESMEVFVDGWGKYGGRCLGSIKLDGIDLAEELIAMGYAVPYDGGKKISWCN